MKKLYIIFNMLGFLHIHFLQAQEKGSEKNDAQIELLEVKVVCVSDQHSEIIDGAQQAAPPGAPTAPQTQTSPPQSQPAQAPAIPVANPTTGPASSSTPAGITQLKATEFLKEGKVSGQPFDLKNHKRCYVITKKYKEDASPEEIKEAFENIYFGIRGPEDIF